MTDTPDLREAQAQAFRHSEHWGAELARLRKLHAVTDRDAEALSQALIRAETNFNHFSERAAGLTLQIAGYRSTR